MSLKAVSFKKSAGVLQLLRIALTCLDAQINGE
jgi:hypothetical protein